MIKAVIIDPQGTLVPDNKEHIQKEMSNYIGVSELDLQKFTSMYSPLAIIGKKKLIDVYELAMHGLDKDSDPKDVTDRHLGLFEHYFNIHPSFEETINRLKDNYWVACLTNVEPEIEEIKKDKGLFDLFHHSYPSSTLKKKMPSEGALLAVLNDLGIKPEEAVFITANKENYRAAEWLGAKPIMYHTQSGLEGTLSDLCKRF